jgi:hypothetical protein
VTHNPSTVPLFIGRLLEHDPPDHTYKSPPLDPHKTTFLFLFPNIKILLYFPKVPFLEVKVEPDKFHVL